MRDEKRKEFTRTSRFFLYLFVLFFGYAAFNRHSKISLFDKARPKLKIRATLLKSTKGIEIGLNSLQSQI